MHKLIFALADCNAMNPSAFSSQLFEQSLLIKCNVVCNGDAHQGEMSLERRGVKCKGKSKGQWTSAEDSLLLHLVEKYGQQQWARIATNLPGRRGKQCRERWQNHLRPDIKREEWSLEEECQLVKLHEQFGNKWAQIARRLPGRPENAIKNHWNATLRSKNRRKPRKVGESPSVLHDYIQRIHHSTTLSPTNTNTSQDGNELQKILFNINDDDYVCQAPSSEEGSSSDLLEDVVGLALQQNNNNNNNNKYYNGHHYDGHQYDHRHHHNQYDNYHHHEYNSDHLYNYHHHHHHHHHHDHDHDSDHDHDHYNNHHHHMDSPPLISLQSHYPPPHLGHDIDLFELVSSSVMS